MAEEAQPEGDGGREAGGSKIAAWWRDRVVTPLLDQLRRGVDAPSLARSTAMGVAVGLGPLPGLSSVIVGAIAVAGGHNMVAAQVAQLVMAPGKQPRPATLLLAPVLTSCVVALFAVQLALLIPWMRSGEWLTGWTPTALADVTRFTDGDIAGSLGTFALQALALWSFDGDRGRAQARCGRGSWRPCCRGSYWHPSSSH